MPRVNKQCVSLSSTSGNLAYQSCELRANLKLQRYIEQLTLDFQNSGGEHWVETQPKENDHQFNQRWCYIRDEEL